MLSPSLLSSLPSESSTLHELQWQTQFTGPLVWVVWTCPSGGTKLCPRGCHQAHHQPLWGQVHTEAFHLPREGGTRAARDGTLAIGLERAN